MCERERERGNVVRGGESERECVREKRERENV